MTNSIIPSPFEKMSLKFILDEIRDRKLEKEEPSVAEKPTSEETVHKICGTAETEMNSPESEPEPVVPVSELGLPDGKKYFRIGEVSNLVGVESYVLRYWESEFKNVKPVKTSAGHRVYARKDVELLHRIRILLHVEKFSIKGAKRAIAQLKHTGNHKTGANPRYAVALKEMAGELKTLIQLAKSW